MLHLSKNHFVRVFPWTNRFRLAPPVRFALASLLLQGKPSCQRAEDPHVGVREVIEQEAKQETVSQRQESQPDGGGGGDWHRLPCAEQQHYKSWGLFAILSF